MRGILMFLPRRDDDAVHQDQTDGNAICLFGNIIHWRWKIHKPCWDQNVYRKYFINFVVIFLVFSQSSFSIWSCCVDTRINQSWIDIYWLIPQTIWDIDAGLFSSDITHFLCISFHNFSIGQARCQHKPLEQDSDLVSKCLVFFCGENDFMWYLPCSELLSSLCLKS